MFFWEGGWKGGGDETFSKFVKVSPKVLPKFWQNFMSSKFQKKKNTSFTAKAVYFVISREAAPSAAVPEETDVRYDVASVSATVTSHIRQHPLLHGMRVIPSGRFPSDLASPDGSLTAGILARPRDRHSKSFSYW